jgi:hypothetical protein
VLRLWEIGKRIDSFSGVVSDQVPELLSTAHDGELDAAGKVGSLVPFLAVPRRDWSLDSPGGCDSFERCHLVDSADPCNG